MYRRILIAADPEGLVAGAGPAVAELAEPEGARVRLLTVGTETGRAAVEPEGEEVVRQLSQELETRHLPVDVERREADGGRVADVIGDAAREFQADLIVLGSHRRGDIAGFFVGSVGNALASRVSTPILVVARGRRQAPAGLRRVLVAVDGGELSHQAVVTTATLAGPETEVTALYVDNSAGGLGAYPLYVDPTPAEEEGSRALDDALEVLREAGVRAAGKRVYGLEGTAAAIARAADDLDADLVVLGSRRPGNVEALLLGSVARSVIARTQRTVLVATGATPPGKPGGGTATAGER